MTDTGRQHDIMELLRLHDRETDMERRAMIRRTIQVIKNESGLVRSMRERLVRAHKNGDKWEIKDIHDFIKGKSQYGQ